MLLHQVIPGGKDSTVLPGTSSVSLSFSTPKLDFSGFLLTSSKSSIEVAELAWAGLGFLQKLFHPCVCIVRCLLDCASGDGESRDGESRCGSSLDFWVAVILCRSPVRRESEKSWV